MCLAVRTHNHACIHKYKRRPTYNNGKLGINNFRWKFHNNKYLPIYYKSAACRHFFHSRSNDRVLAEAKRRINSSDERTVGNDERQSRQHMMINTFFSILADKMHRVFEYLFERHFKYSSSVQFSISILHGRKKSGEKNSHTGTSPEQLSGYERSSQSPSSHRKYTSSEQWLTPFASHFRSTIHSSDPSRLLHNSAAFFFFSHSLNIILFSIRVLDGPIIRFEGNEIDFCEMNSLLKRTEEFAHLMKEATNN